MTRFSQSHAAVTLILLTATVANAVQYTSVKKINIEQTPTQSPFWVNGPTGSGTTYLPTVGMFANSPAGGVFAPTTETTIGDTNITSITTRGIFDIVGNSTSAGNWVDNNGIPAGITLSFTAEFTVSVGAGSPPGSWLTAGANNVALGINQVAQGQAEDGPYDSIDSVNLNDIEPDFIPGDSDEILQVSAVTVSEVQWSGSLTEPGFENHQFTGDFVGNFGTYVLRANAVTEDAETFGMYVEGAPTDPDNPSKPTIGFGGPSMHESERNAGYGEGVVASHIAIENSFSSQNVIVGLGQPWQYSAPTWYPRQVGAWTLDPTNGTIGLKGIGYEYDVKFSITDPNAGLDGDFNQDNVVDAADYVVWRKGLNGNPPDPLDYQLWRTNFGSSPGAGAASAVPEPATTGLLFIGLLAFNAARRPKRALGLKRIG